MKQFLDCQHCGERVSSDECDGCEELLCEHCMRFCSRCSQVFCDSCEEEHECEPSA